MDSGQSERAVEAVLESLRDDVESENVEATIHEDDSNMTPMLVVEFGQGADRTTVLRTLYRAEGPVEVTGIYDHRAVVRGADWGE